MLSWYTNVEDWMSWCRYIIKTNLKMFKFIKNLIIAVKKSGWQLLYVKLRYREKKMFATLGIVQILCHHFREKGVCQSLTIDDNFQGGRGKTIMSQSFRSLLVITFCIDLGYVLLVNSLHIHLIVSCMCFHVPCAPRLSWWFFPFSQSYCFLCLPSIRLTAEILYCSYFVAA